MRLYYYILLLFTLFTFASCSGRKEYDDIPFDSKIVVEGWIEEGDIARVILMRSIPINETVDSSNFLQYVVRAATVTVSDGVDVDTLRLKSAAQYLPPFVYVGDKIIGKTNGQYSLAVSYTNITITAKTQIPQSVPIEKVEYIRQSPTDTVGNIQIRFTDPVNEQNYYQVATQLKGHDDRFIPALYGNINDKSFTSADVVFKVTRGITIFPHTNFEPHFTGNDTIFVKLRTMPKHGFDFWNSWQNEIINARNPIFPANSSLKSNVNGGVGIWCGYGQSTIRIVAQ